MPYASNEDKRRGQNERSRRRRAEWIDANGPCAKCGSSEQLEVDHIDPALKTLPAGELWSRRKETREAELAKCQVLCRPCHDAKTYAELGGHGTASRYEKKGCRCQDCRAAHAVKIRDWRRRRRER